MSLMHITPKQPPQALSRKGSAGLEWRGSGGYGYSASIIPDGVAEGGGARSIPCGQVLWKRKWAVLLAALLGGAAAYGVSALMPKVYRAGALIEIQNLNEDFLNMRSVIPTAPGSAFESPEYNIRTQAAILTSRPVLERTLNKL